MILIINILNILILGVFVLSVLNVLRHTFSFVRNLMKPTPDKFVMGSKQLVYLGISISLIIALMVKGLTIC